MNIHCKSNREEQLQKLTIQDFTHERQTHRNRFRFFFSLLLQIHFRSWLTKTSLPFHLSTGRNAKPISSCISLIRDFNMCHPVGGQPLWHVHNTHTHTNTPPRLDSSLQLLALPVAWPASLLRADHMWPRPACRWWRGKRGNHAGNRSRNTHPLSHLHTLKGHCPKIEANQRVSFQNAIFSSWKYICLLWQKHDWHGSKAHCC